MVGQDRSNPSLAPKKLIALTVRRGSATSLRLHFRWLQHISEFDFRMNGRCLARYVDDRIGICRAQGGVAFERVQVRLSELVIRTGRG